MSTLYTPEEAAEKLRHISAHEIRRRIRAGEIDYVEASRGKWLLSEDHIGQLIESLTTKAKAAAAKRPAPSRRPSPFGETSRSARTSRHAEH